MICFLQLLATDVINIEYRSMTINVSDINRIIVDDNDEAVIVLKSTEEEKVYLFTPYSYEDLLETLSGFQKVEMIEMLPDRD